MKSDQVMKFSFPTYIGIYQNLKGCTCVFLENGIYCFYNIMKGRKA